jgi:transcriptional regulator with XRE-family HTH domain
VAQASVTFSSMLRRLRAGVRLTQGELARAANLSVRAVSDLERGVATTPHRDTVRLLADALYLTARPGLSSRRPREASQPPAGRRRRGRCRGISPRSPGGDGSWPSWWTRRRGRAG